ncbi:MAG: hypothetical protein HXY50_09150, partial [Ignavibacteriaceae bacterium]|nr:hypothetical protein [Ignavibacteriaceae bacterium]
MFQKIADIQIRPRNSYYKFRIIFTFVAVTVGLVILMSQLSYIFIRKIYLEQVEEQVLSSIKSISKQIEKPYLNILDLGLPTQSTSEYFIKLFRNNLSGDLTNAAFLFDSAFTVYVHSEADFTSGRENSQLML